MRSPIHPEGFFLAGLLSLLALVASRISRFLGWAIAVFAGFTLFFFRDPERHIPTGAGLIVSPADGEVVGIDSVDEVSFIRGPAKRVSIFLSVMDVHINRAPIEGKVVYRHFQPGAFLPAYAPDASTRNEQNTIGIDDQGFRVMVRQIAGIVARRIVCWANPGDTLARGERFGLIRFGSRTEIFMPLSATIEVKIGQTVQGGATIIARRNP